MIILEDRIPLHLQDGRRIPVDPREILMAEKKEPRRANIISECLASFFSYSMNTIGALRETMRATVNHITATSETGKVVEFPSERV